MMNDMVLNKAHSFQINDICITDTDCCQLRSSCCYVLPINIYFKLCKLVHDI